MVVVEAGSQVWWVRGRGEARLPQQLLARELLHARGRAALLLGERVVDELLDVHLGHHAQRLVGRHHLGLHRPATARGRSERARVWRRRVCGVGGQRGGVYACWSARALTLITMLFWRALRACGGGHGGRARGRQSGEARVGARHARERWRGAELRGAQAGAAAGPRALLGALLRLGRHRAEARGEPADLLRRLAAARLRTTRGAR